MRSVCWVPLVLLLALARHDVVEAAESPVLLGLNYPLTGPYSAEGLDQIRAARLAVDAVNAQGGILGRRVSLMALDSSSDVLRSELNARKMIDAGCAMIFGGASSAVAIAVGEICQKRGVPFFGTLTYSTATTLENAHRYVFRECNDSSMSAKVLAPWLKRRYPTGRYYYITADYTWGWTTEQSLREATDTRDRTQCPGALTPLGATDFEAVLSQAAASKPDVLVLTLFGKDMVYALQQARAMGLKERCCIVVPNLTLGMAERAGPKAMEGVVGTLPWAWNIPFLYGFPRGKAFVEAFVQRFHRYPCTSGASAYTIVNEYKAAVERSRSLEPRRVVSALEGHAYELLKDRQVWRALDHQSAQTVFLVSGNGPDRVLADRFHLDYFTVLDSLAGDAAIRPEREWKTLRARAGLPDRLEPLDNP